MQKVLIKTSGIGIIISNKKTRILSKRNRCFVNGIAHQICAIGGLFLEEDIIMVKEKIMSELKQRIAEAGLDHIRC